MADRAIASAFVTIVPSLQGFSKDLNQQLSSTMSTTGKNAGGDLANNTAKGFKSKMGGAFRPVLGALAASFSAVAVGGFLKDSVRAASDLNESLNAVNVTFGASADEIMKLGKRSAGTIGLSESAFNGLAVQFSAFAKTVAGKGGNVAGVIDELSRRGADFASVMNLDVNEAMRLFQSGLAGETEPLRKFGIDLSAAAVEAYALEQGIWDGKGTMSESQKVMARYQALMEQTEKTAGDFANTSDDLANKNRINAARFEDAKASLGTSLVPAMEMAADIINKKLIPAFESVGDWMKNNPEDLKIITGVMAGLATAIGLAAIAQWNLNAALWSNPVGLAVAVIVAFAGAMWYAYENSAALRETLDNLFTELREFWVKYGPAITTAIKILVDSWLYIFTTTWNTIATVISIALKLIENTFMTMYYLFTGKWGKIPGLWAETFSSIGKSLKSWLVSQLKAVSKFVGGLADALDSDFLRGIRNSVNDVIGNINGSAEIQYTASGMPKLADGGFVNRPTMALIGEAGPEVVTPLRDFERMMGMDQKSDSARPIQVGGKTVAWLQELVDGRAEIVVNGAFAQADQYGRQFV